MTEHSHESFLPKVSDSDLAYVVLGDIIDSEHIERWDKFARAQPSLAREVLKRIYYSNESLLVRKHMIDEITFVISALEAAAERRLAPSGDVVVEAQQPSGEPDVDQQAG